MKIIWASHLELTCFPSNQSLLNLRISWIRAGPIHTHNTTHNKGNHCQLHCNRFLSSDQKIVGNSLQPIGIIITGNLFIKAPRWEAQYMLLVSVARSRSKEFPSILWYGHHLEGSWRNNLPELEFALWGGTIYTIDYDVVDRQPIKTFGSVLEKMKYG